MRLLVSVADADEARAALEGGADIVDAKNPAAGPLGAVDASVLREIVRAVDGRLPMSAALGDAIDERQIAEAARRASAERLAYIKVGFAGTSDARTVERLIAAAVQGAEMVSASAGVVAVAYADFASQTVASVSPWWLVEVAERTGAIGVLLDTALKAAQGSGEGERTGLLSVMSESEVTLWVRHARAADLMVGVAGGLTGAQLSLMRAIGVDVVGVRGAACETGERLGRVTRERVAALARSAGRRSWSRQPGVTASAHTASARDGATSRAAPW